MIELFGSWTVPQSILVMVTSILGAVVVALTVICGSRQRIDMTPAQPHREVDSVGLANTVVCDAEANPVNQ